MIPSDVPTCEVRELGRISYPEARELQERVADEIANGRCPPTLLLLEHPPTFTLGRRAREEDLLWGEAERSLRGIETYRIDRGGQATYHGPGQLVGYPLLSLGRPDGAGQIPRADYTGYLRQLEAVLIEAALEFGLAAGQVTGHTGIWVQPDIASRCPRCPPDARKSPAKLASIGVRIDSRGVTRHGFALNVDPDMSHWEGIVACGEPGRPSVSFAQLLEPVPDPIEVRQSVIRSFGQVFGFQMVTFPSTSPPDLVGAPTREPTARARP
ncbi:MAG: lipoyl(octanoyl) transferase LipB [Anaerolineales bacterium]